MAKYEKVKKKGSTSYKATYSCYNSVKRKLEPKFKHNFENKEEVFLLLDGVAFSAINSMIEEITFLTAKAETRKKIYIYSYILPELESMLLRLINFIVDKNSEGDNFVIKKAKKLDNLINHYRPNVKTEFIKTGSNVLDQLFSNGNGIPKGTISTLAGPSGLGKTTSALHISKSFCQQGKKVLYIDTESAINDSILNGTGLLEYYNADQEKCFILLNINTFKHLEEIVDCVLEEGGIDLIVIDTVTGLMREDSMKKSVEETDRGDNARSISKFLSKYKSLLFNKGITLLLVNQLRTNVNMSGKSFDKEYGGHALEYYPDCKIMMGYFDNKKLKSFLYNAGDKVPYGVIIKIWSEKSKYANPFKEHLIHLIFGEKISDPPSDEDVFMGKGVVTKIRR